MGLGEIRHDVTLACDATRVQSSSPSEIKGLWDEVRPAQAILETP